MSTLAISEMSTMQPSCQTLKVVKTILEESFHQDFTKPILNPFQNLVSSAPWLMDQVAGAMQADL